MNCADYIEKDIKNNIEIASRKLEEKDYYLLKHDINERSISHKLAIYLEPLFKDWDVDCEYNKDHDVTKRLKIYPKQINSDDRTVYPDIIIHKRGSIDNLLAIEIKKTTNNDTGEYDVEKLKAFKKDLGYCFAVALKVKTGCNDYRVEKPFFI